MRKIKKILGMAMALVLTAGAVRAGIIPENRVMAEDTTFDEGAHGTKLEEGSCGVAVKYAIYSDGSLYINGSGKMKDYQYSSTTPSPFENNLKITKLYVKSGISYIGSEAFYGCTNLKELYIPSSVASVGGLAFEGTAWLTAQIRKNPLVCLNNVLIDARSSKGSVTVPEGTKRIADRAFEGNGAVTGVKIPAGVTSVGEETFYQCSNLNFVQLPDGLKTIGDYAFSECKRLISVNLPDTITQIGEGAFCDCVKLSTVKIPTGIKELKPSMFWNCRELETVVVPGNVSTIGKEAFYSCMKLKTVVIENGVHIINEDAFTYCDALEKIAIPSSVVKIDNTAFYDYISDLTIYGTAGSEAQTFAKKQKIPFSTEKVTIPITTVKQGDVDGNGTVTLSDAQIALKVALNLIDISDDMKKRADVDGDTYVTLKDAQKILKIALNLI